MPPNVRCMYFDEDGRSIGSGCPKGSTCAFVHPRDTNWDTASKSYRKLGKRRSFDTGSASRSHGKHSRDDSWGAPPSSANSVSDTREAPTSGAPSVTSSNTIQLSDSSRWGKSAVAKTSVAESTPHLDPPAEAMSAWERFSKDGQPTSGAWGESTSGWGSSASGWDKGEGSSGWSTEASGNGGWGDVISAPGWGSDAVDGNNAWGGGNEDKGETGNKGKGKADVVMRDPSPPRKAQSPSPSHSYMPSTKSNSAAPPASNSVGEPSNRNRAVPDSPIPSFVSMKPQPFMKPGLRTTALELLKLDKGGSTKASSSERDLSSPISIISPKKYSGPKGHAELFSDIIKYMRNAVVYEVLALRTQEDSVRFKKMQQSNEFSRATPLTRVILSDKRVAYDSKHSSRKKWSTRAVEHLVKLPDISTRASKKMGPMATKQDIMSYTEELKLWFQDLELHKRLLAEDDISLNASENLTASRTIREILEQDNWSWRDLQQAVAELEVMVKNTQANAYEELWTQGHDVDELMDDLEGRLPSAEADQDQPLHDFTDNIQRTSNGIDTVGNALEEQSVQVAALLHKIADLQNELETLKAERIKIEETCDEAEALFAEFELQNKQDVTELRELSDKISRLHLLKRPRTKSTHLPPQPVKINDILELIRPVIVKQLKDDLDPVLRSFALRCKENQTNLMAELDTMVKPLQDKTEELYNVSNFQAP